MLTISGFLLRGYWTLTGSDLRNNRASRIVPHVIDTLFFASGVLLIVTLHLDWMRQPWLLAKFAGLFFYIGLGMVAFRFGRAPRIRLLAFVGAVVSFIYIVGAALAKSPASWLAYLTV